MTICECRLSYEWIFGFTKYISKEVIWLDMNDRKCECRQCDSEGSGCGSVPLQTIIYNSNGREMLE